MARKLISRECTLSQNETIVHKNDRDAHILRKSSELELLKGLILQHLIQTGKGKGHRRAAMAKKSQRAKEIGASKVGFRALRQIHKADRVEVFRAKMLSCRGL